MRMRRYWLVGAFLMLSGADCEEGPPKPELDLIVRRWWFTQFPDGAVSEVNVGADRVQVGGVATEKHDFGPLVLQPPGLDPHAFAEVYSNESGATYWVSAQAPNDGLIGDSANLLQYQYFKKTAADATLTVVVSKAFLEAIDGNPGFPTATECRWHKPGASYDDCGRVMWGRVTVRIEAFDFFDQETFFRTGGYAEITGWRGFFGYDARTYGDSLTPFWDRSSFIFDPDLQSTDGGHAIVALLAPKTFRIPLSSVGVGDTFYVSSNVRASTLNLRQRESYLSAFFRDPQGSDGLTFEYAGVEPIETPTDAPVPTVSLPAPPCASGASDPAAGTIAFESATFAAPELPGEGATVIVTRSGGSEGAVSALVTSADDTALAGGDYTTLSTLVLFADGEEGSRAVRVPLVTDADAEPDETVNLTLSDPKGCATLGPQSTAVLSILDDDRPIVGPDTFTVGGTVTGLEGTGLVLQEVTSGFEASPTGGAFTFDYNFISGTDYEVRVAQQPHDPFQVCTVTNASGTIAGANVTNVAVDCVTVPDTGGLDPGFGSGGKVTDGVPATAMALQSDGKIVLVGDRTLSRYLSDGRPDTGFGTGGQAPITFGGSSDIASAVAIQPDGKIVVAGQARSGASIDFGVARFLASGMPDTGFGNGGKNTIDFVGAVDQAWAVLIQGDGRIVLAGHAQTPTPLGPDNDFAVARVTAGGVLDGTFGTGGKTMTNIAGKTDLGHAAVLQSDDKIVLVGRVADGGGDDPDVGIVRYTAGGLPDGSFGTNGIKQIDLAGGAWNEAIDAAIQASGKIVVAVEALIGPSFAFQVARFDTGGVLDTGFGVGGVANAMFSDKNDFIRGLALTANGGIVLVGQTSNLMQPDFGIASFSADGAVDTGFGTDGKLVVDFFGASDGAECVAVQPDGKIVVGGLARNGTTNGLGLIRILP